MVRFIDRRRGVYSTAIHFNIKQPTTYSATHPQTTIASSTAHNNNNRASSPAVDRSSTSLANDFLLVPHAPTGLISIVARYTASELPFHGHSKRARRSTTCSAIGKPWRSAASTKEARARGGVLVLVLVLEVRGRKAIVKEERRGLVSTRRVPRVWSDSSPGEGTMLRDKVRSCANERMDLANVS